MKQRHVLAGQLAGGERCEAEGMEYSLEEAEDAVTVNVKGSFTFHDYKQWCEVIENLFATDTSRHIVDLTGVENIASAGTAICYRVN